MRIFTGVLDGPQVAVLPTRKTGRMGRFQTAVMTTVELPEALDLPSGTAVQIRFRPVPLNSPRSWLAEKQGSRCLLRRGVKSMIVPCEAGFPAHNQSYQVSVDTLGKPPQLPKFKHDSNDSTHDDVLR